MGLLHDAVFELFLDHPFENVEHDEAMALVDALAMAVYADFEVNDYEEGELNELLCEFEWAWATNVRQDGSLDAALERAKNIHSATEVAELARDVASRVADGREEPLFELMVQITTADGEVNMDERKVLDAFAKALEIHADRASEIVDAGIAEMDV